MLLFLLALLLILFLCGGFYVGHLLGLVIVLAIAVLLFAALRGRVP